MRLSFFLLLFLTPFFSKSQQEPIALQTTSIGEDMAHRASYIKDTTGGLGIQEVLQLDRPYKKIKSRRKNFGRPLDPIWIRFQVKNGSDQDRKVLIETSRAMTNEIQLYKVKNGRVVDSMRSGDHFPFSDRPFTHRLPVFPVELDAGETSTYYLRMDANGATVVLSLKAWTKEAFQSFDQKERLFLGLFYGFLLFVILIFSFFYFELKERSFLFYFLYVLNVGMLLFCLDGFSYRFFFPETPYLADRAVLFFSFSSILFHLLYARDYLRFWKNLPRIDSLVKILAILALSGILISFSKGTLYRIGFPLSHLFSFSSPIFLVSCAIYLRSKGHQISMNFLMAFILLLGGIILLLLGNIGVTPPGPITVHWLKFGVLGEISSLSLTMAEKYRQLRLEKEEAKKESMEKLEELNRLKDAYNEELEETVNKRTSELEQRTEELESERAKLRDVNQSVFSSIRYAQRIQTAILPGEEEISPLFQDHFVFFRPRDIVSGDIYWFASVRTSENDPDLDQNIPRVIGQETAPDDSDLALFAAMDCTGHGVPGAFLSILGHDILNQTLKEPRVNRPVDALTFLDFAVQRTFERSKNDHGEVKDGMDMSMCALDRGNLKLHFAGAQNPCYVVREGTLYELQGDKHAIGERIEEASNAFTHQSFDLEKGDAIYLFSDGYADQFGGPKGKKFKYKPFKQMLCDLHHLDMKEQLRIIEETFDSWKQDHEQVDDVLVIGVRV